MDYSLAKELKDAGFPQLHEIPGSNERGLVVYDPEQKHALDTEAYFPSLEELIKACGGNFFSLRNLGVGWQACTDNEQFCSGEAKTPTEAVARLFLALKKHDK